MNFWDKVFETPAQSRQPINPPLTFGLPRAWWQDQDRVTETLNHGYGVPTQQDQGGGLTEAEIKQIRKRGHGQISSDEAEMIAEYDLAHKDKYLNECPQCGSGNFLPAGMRMGNVVMPTNKCFDCGGGARSPEPALGSASGKGSISTRQIDTGGGGGSMYMRLSGTPRSYIPRG